MRFSSRWALMALAASLAVTGSAFAQVIPGNRGPGRTPDDTGKVFQFNIKRRAVSGTVKSLDEDRKVVMLEQKGKEMPIDVGPSLIKAGPGKATFADIKVGDKISVYGESTVQGGLRAMEITLPKERMSIPPPKRDKAAIKAEKEAVREAKRVAREEKKKAAAAKKAEEAEKKAARKAEKEAEAAEKKAGKGKVEKEEPEEKEEDEK